MSDTMNSKKMWSGRFLLCLVAAFSMLLFTGVVAYLMVVMKDEKSLTIALTMIGNVMVSVVTFYFTKQMNQGAGQ